MYKEQGRVRELCQQINKLSAKVEDLHDENTVLRLKAGLGEADRVDIKDVRMQKEAAITQLRSLNALLERQVGVGSWVIVCGFEVLWFWFIYLSAVICWLHRFKCECLLVGLRTSWCGSVQQFHVLACHQVLTVRMGRHLI